MPPGGKLLSFVLNGKQPLSEVVAKKFTVAPIGATASKETVDAGAALFAQWCGGCHGFGAAGGGATPDLRYSHPTTFDQYRDIVRDGKSLGRGMPSLKRWLTAEQVDAIRAYVLTRRAALTAQQ